jgi:diketogulonate reductase-like aldo/keto reductase
MFLHNNMNALAPTIEIAPGVHMPWVVDGDLHHPNASTSYDTWFKTGGRGVDTAWSYFNQAAVGKALHSQKYVTRSEIFLQTKIECMGSVAATLQAGQHDLDLLEEDFVDLMLIHAPWQGWGEPYSNCSKGPAGKAARQATWRGMEALQRAGKVRSIGVSNFNADELEEVLEVATIPPAVNQIGICVGFIDNATIAFSRAHNITTQAYSPLGGSPWGGSPVMRLPELQPIAKAHNKSAAQVALRWIVQQEIPFATATDNAEHIQEDMDVFGWSLSTHEMAVLSSIRSGPPPWTTTTTTTTKTTTTTQVAAAAGVGRARLSERRSNGHCRLNGRCPLPPQLRGLPE